MNKDFISLAEGSGGKEMEDIIADFGFSYRGNWENCNDDGATFDLGDGRSLVFTSDSFVVSPIFFPGANIGHLAFSGTVNDLAVMGAKPLGLSLSLIIEEGFSKEDLNKIIVTIKKLSVIYKVPVVTGDTKVMEKGKIDGIVINTSGVGIINTNGLLTKKINAGDKIIISGGLGEHAVALLSKRFNYESDIISDSKPIIEEILSVKNMIKIAKDPTRGGIAAALNEICTMHNKGMLIMEEDIPAKTEVVKVVEMLGINLYELASEGRFVCIASKENAKLVEKKLKEFNKDAKIIGEITDDKNNLVVLQTLIGKRILPKPTGRIVPRIC